MVYLSLLSTAAGIGMGINMTCQCVGGYYLAWFVGLAGGSGLVKRLLAWDGGERRSV